MRFDLSVRFDRSWSQHAAGWGGSMSYSLINLMYDAHGGNAMENLARHYGLPMDTAERVVEALLPAFSIGLKHNTANPLSLSSFLRALQTGHHQRFFADPMAAFAPTRRHEEDVILGHLLGSKDISRAVADQVEATTGVATAVVREMLPAVAAILMGGLAKEAPRNPFTAPMEEFFEGFARGRPEPEPEPVSPALGLLDAFGAFFEGFGRRGEDEEPDDEDSTEEGHEAEAADLEIDADEAFEEQRPVATGEDLFGSLFETGLDIQRAQFNAMMDIFSRFEGTEGGNDVDEEE